MTHKRLHSEEHHKDEIDELLAELLGTDETNVERVLVPDSEGGVGWLRAPLRTNRWLFRQGTTPEAFVSGTEYTIVGRGSFRGTDKDGTPSAIKAIFRRSGGATSAEIRIYDVTNALTIAEATTTSNVFELRDLGELDNLPTGAAIFEVQLKRTGGVGQNNFADISELVIEW